MANVPSVWPLFHLDYIIPTLISCVLQSLPVARPSNGLPPQSGLSTYRVPELFLWRPPRLQRQKNSLIWRLKERAPAVCRYRLIKTKKNNIWVTHTLARKKKKIKNNLVVKTRGGMEQWQSGSFGNFLSAFIRVMWSWLFCRDQSNLWADGIALLWWTGDCLCFFQRR